jgi:putative transposase
MIIAGWRKNCCQATSHSALSFQPPAPEAIVKMESKPIMH